MINENPKNSSYIGFIARFSATHTAVYFISGLIFALLCNYQELFATAEYSFMRPFNHPLVAMGPALQIIRGAFLAIAFLPFRKVINENDQGWKYLAVALWILIHVFSDATDPGKYESFIYADFPLSIHLSTWPEQIFSVLSFSWLFHRWERNPKERRLTVPIIALVVISILTGILGVLFG